MASPLVEPSPLDERSPLVKWLEPLDDITSAESLGKKKKKKKRRGWEMTEKKKKVEEEDVNEWLSFYGTCFKPYEPLNVFMIHGIESDPAAMIYKIDGLNAPPETLDFFKPTYNLKVLGSLNGMVALYEDGFAYLFDPNLPREGSVVHIPAPLSLRGVRGGFNPGLFGLCYDSVEDEYKGLLCDLETNVYPNMFFICVLSFKRGTYACKPQFGVPYLSPLQGNTATVAKGVPYWICEDLIDQSILMFDQKAERLEILPPVPNRRQVQKLGTLDEQLTATTIYDKEKIEIWSFEECSKEPLIIVWMPLFVLSTRACVSTLSWMIKNVEVLLKNAQGKLVVYNFREGSMRLLSMVLQRKIRGNPWITVAY